MIYNFDVVPMGKPRMTRRDAWAKRPCVLKYWAYKDALVEQARAMNYSIDPGESIVLFHVPMAKSWSKKKKLEMHGTIHENKPDVDNLLKGFMDCLCPDGDQAIYAILPIKVWSYEGHISVLNELGIGDILKKFGL